MTERVSPASGIHGLVNVPGDKSISYRYAMLASIAEGETQIYNYSSAADCESTLSCMRALGVRAEYSEQDSRRVLTIAGQGLGGLRPAQGRLDAGNSGSTIRMLSGILAAQPFTTEISGDASLVRRPMRRILTPLSQMGARIEAVEDQFPPLTIHGDRLRGIDYEMPVASAQVKSCVLLAGLFAEGETIVHEAIKTRDHTELALRELGADIEAGGRVTRLRGGRPLQAKPLVVPGDLSSAALFIIAALMLRDSDVTIANVGLNPTRTALLDVLRGMGASIRVVHVEEVNGELIGTLQVRNSRIRGGTVEGATTAALIDEIPILSVLGAVSDEGLSVRDARELRVKESDRIETISGNLQRRGVVVHAYEDGLRIPGKQRFRAANVDTCGDHRIAMAFSIAALAADEPCAIEQAEAASVSFPEFYNTLRQLTQ
jgi:3-phosphoshikimate 1-carboxyvinyltransferase